ncbi:sugar O-acetyltransferase [Nocardioides albus]|uniref:Maltose O-acetyltransferase n=1 Tax=Nocardioides albus TaxID=1841 RepID=A0A7W5F8T2_9ACTN|nr:sugar O-acetyltransferase [Nocardioides albus]MBB3089559.1 maltose O-acetyltransferase [Nocardioides albus]GGU30933.1 maltose O-acetyltransferase [Nocardioides albus]
MGEQRARLEAGEWYLDDAELQRLRRDCWRRLDRFNGAAADDDDVRDTVLRELLGEVGSDVEVVPRFQCSYGYNIRMGDRAFVNANAFFMDDAPIRVGADVRMGPGAQLVTALHPIDDAEKRREGWERALPIEIGSNVWLGTSVTVGAGVRIGADSEIGAGSVVLSDVPDRVVAAGTPARVIRHIR